MNPYESPDEEEESTEAEPAELTRAEWQNRLLSNPLLAAGCAFLFVSILDDEIIARFGIKYLLVGAGFIAAGLLLRNWRAKK